MKYDIIILWILGTFGSIAFVIGGAWLAAKFIKDPNKIIKE